MFLIQAKQATIVLGYRLIGEKNASLLAPGTNDDRVAGASGDHSLHLGFIATACTKCTRVTKAQPAPILVENSLDCKDKEARSCGKHFAQAIR